MSRQIEIAPNWRRDAAERGILIRPLSPGIGSEVTCLDLTTLFDSEVLALLRTACAERAVLVLRGWQGISEEKLTALAAAMATRRKGDACISLVHTVGVPLSFGETRFVDGTAAYEALPEALRHELAAAEAGVARPLVRAHDPSGRPCVDIVGTNLRSLEGLPKIQANNLGAALDAHILRRRLAYTHYWREGDVLLVEDRCRMHSARPPVPRPNPVRGIARAESVGRLAPQAV
ncbi:alpha-ketoglutarate-dependent taurine dioxygenase [Constrictibacter sp. MBR-5]|jgi:alpha-ketoglutarate-dependent taurine dioxygenase|uniref:TauD/TfdA dioxygenase family protein n=1 Tax=Constrictibacter sp. MBR-5 TaxID=3156467 RepID=UPI003391889F